MLNCGIDKQTLGILVSMCENGFNPNGIVRLMKEINREQKCGCTNYYLDHYIYRK